MQESPVAYLVRILSNLKASDNLLYEVPWVVTFFWFFVHGLPLPKHCKFANILVG